MSGGAGDDTLFAGPGDLNLNYGVAPAQSAPGRAEANGADSYSGGDGQDHVSYVRREIPVSVTLDGRANDGAAGEGDDVGSDVERVTGGVREDALSGGPGARRSTAVPPPTGWPASMGRMRWRAGSRMTDEGEDLAGGAGPDALSGGPGADTLSGGDDADALGGGGGTDRLAGDVGDDELHGDADADVLQGGARRRPR